jgi:mono/diheme cytochrome c family protein
MKSRVGSQRLAALISLGALCLASSLLSQSSPPPLPPVPPKWTTPVRPIFPPTVHSNRGPVVVPQITGPAPRVIPSVTHPQPFIPPVVNAVATPGALVWDADQKETTLPAGQLNASFTFHFTNVSSSEAIINSVRTSCGCTTAKLPPMPWRLPPGTNASFEVNLNVAGKFGTVMKSVTVDSTAGVKTLLVKAEVPNPQAQPVAMAPSGISHPNAMESDAERLRNQQMALADRQAVFKGDCAVCHVRPGDGKLGQALFDGVCGVCHEAEHRASMVPDLKSLPHATDADHWRAWISFGRVGSLMPSFAQSQGGPLTDQQIESLVDYLVKSHPSKPGAPKATAVGSSPVSVFPLPPQP